MVMEIPVPIVSEKVLVTVWLSPPVTRTSKVAVVAVDGVPAITPALERVSPLGSVPEARAHVKGDVLPLAARVWL